MKSSQQYQTHSRKRHWTCALAISLAMASGTAAAETRPGNGFYGALFGGVAWGTTHDVTQRGVAHVRGAHALPGMKDFDLRVATQGRAKQRRSKMFGGHVGYRFDLPTSRISPAVEIEGMRLAPRQDADLFNPKATGVANIGASPDHDVLDDPTAVATKKYGPGLHRFATSMRTDVDMLMLNAVFTYRTNGWFEPYAGVGVGLALVEARRAVSHQTNPSGPIEVTPDTGERVNHFNSKDHDKDFAVAWQAKVGLRAALTEHVSAFVEYRLIHVGATDFTFGSTQYTGHASTDHWRVKHTAMRTSTGLIGVQYAL